MGICTHLVDEDGVIHRGVLDRVAHGAQDHVVAGGGRALVPE